jgi:L-histidine N-alpha-methyltransferase
LHVVNHRLGANFRPETYRHRAFYNAADARIEMHLVPEASQDVYVRDLDLSVVVRPDETIWTEISCKYTQDSTAAALAEGGLLLESWYTDPAGLFGIALAAPSS